MNPTQILPMCDTAGRARGVGLLQILKDDRRELLPLAGVTVAARVADRVATVTVSETFRNTLTAPVEAVYIFPLAGGCAVSAFEMRVGKRRIVGNVKERQEARENYRKAKESGKRAALLEQERDDLFTVQVGNLMPGDDVSVEMTYSERLPYFDEGATELRLPLVVAPRYIPGQPVDGAPVGHGTESDTDAVPDASRITPPRLADGFDPKVSLGIEVELLGEFTDLACSQHATKTSISSDRVRVALALDQEPLDRDFVLRWRLAGASVRATCLTYRDGKDTYAMLSVVPPRRDGFLGLARDVVFIVDRSGSMAGVKMASASRACSLLLHTLGPRDRFAVVAFDDRCDWMIPGGPDARFVPADESGLERGDRFLRSIDSRGGTELDGALGESLAAVAARRSTAGRSPVLVLLTDGEVGDEARILKRIQQQLGDARAFTVGIDTAVNDGFLKRLAAIGGGTASFVVPGEALDAALRAVGREIGQPVVTELRVEGPVESGSLAPAALPDLFAGRAATAFFRVTGKGALRVRGKFADGKVFDESVTPSDISLPAVAHLWARARINDLEDTFRIQPELQSDVKTQIVTLSVKHQILTKMTAFVVVDESEVVNATGQAQTIVQPVAMPAKWEMDEEQTESGPMPTMVCASRISAPCSPCPEVSKDVEECDDLKAMQPPPRPQAPKAVHAPPTGAPKKAKAPSGFAGSGKPADRVESPEERQPAADAGPVLYALEEFVRALNEARAALDAGRIPSAQEFEKARAALAKALASYADADRLPALQRFLRTAALELAAALASAAAGAAELKALFARHAEAFEEARKEVTAVPVTKGRSWKFWERSV
jgi:Ca-activated chloride channel family protein